MNQSTSREKAMTLRNVGICYQRGGGIFRRGDPFWAVKDVSFDLNKGEVLGVVGRNGAGKSTLLRLLAGIIRPDKGTFVNNGHKASLLSLQVGFLPYLTGRKNAILSGLLLGLTYSEIEQKMSAIAEFSQLGDFFEEPIHTYSSGMKARLGFSIAFHADPDVLLIDEVLGVGDVDFRKQSEAAMREKIRSGKTVVLVSHSAATIRQLCDRAVWIEGGITRMEGDPDTVLVAYEGGVGTNPSQK